MKTPYKKEKRMDVLKTQDLEIWYSYLESLHLLYRPLPRGPANAFEGSFTFKDCLKKIRKAVASSVSMGTLIQIDALLAPRKTVGIPRGLSLTDRRMKYAEEQWKATKRKIKRLKTAEKRWRKKVVYYQKRKASGAN